MSPANDALLAKRGDPAGVVTLASPAAGRAEREGEAGLTARSQGR